jgi:hypothetical protein
VTIRRVRLTAPGAQVRRLQDGFCYLEWDDAATDANAMLAAFVQGVSDGAQRAYGIAPSGEAAIPRQAAPRSTIGDSPLTIQPPSISMGLAGMVGPGSGGGGVIVPAGIRPPPSPHGIGSPGNQQPLAVPGLPALPQPGISAPPPIPNMSPAAATFAQPLAMVPAPLRRGPVPAIGSAAPRAAAQARQQFLDPAVVQAKIQADWEAEGPALSRVDGRELQTDPTVPTLPQPGILAPPPPPVIRAQLLGPDGRNLPSSANLPEDETRPDESSEAPAT